MSKHWGVILFELGENEADSSSPPQVTKRWHYCYIPEFRVTFPFLNAITWWPPFQTLSPLHSCFIFINSYLRWILASRHCFTPSVTRETQRLITQWLIYNAWSPYQRHLDLTPGTQFKCLHSKPHAAAYSYSFLMQELSFTNQPGFLHRYRNTLYILLQPKATAEKGADLPSAAALDSVWKSFYYHL